MSIDRWSRDNGESASRPGTGTNQAKFVARAHELHQILDAAQLEHFTVVNDERSVTDVAHEVLRQAGWLTSGADGAEPNLRSEITRE